MHVGERELVLTLVLDILRILAIEEVVQGALLHPLPILLGSHQYRGVQIRVADL